MKLTNKQLKQVKLYLLNAGTGSKVRMAKALKIEPSEVTRMLKAELSTAEYKIDKVLTYCNVK